MAREERFARTQALLIGTCLSLAALSCYLGWRLAYGPTRESPSLQRILEDDGARQVLIEALAAGSEGFYDSFSDPDVGRIFLPGLETDRPTGISSNSLGMREREYELPKPQGLHRVVLLGDSFLEGASVAADERLGVFLQRYLTERLDPKATAKPKIEVLHIAIPSWNAVASSNYLRRHISDLQPDLVIHVLNPNDVEDSGGVRGFGGMAHFSAQHRRRADGMLMIHHPRLRMGITTSNYLASGLDWESKRRYGVAARALEDVAGSTEMLGGRYVALLHFPGSMRIAQRLLVTGLYPRQVAYTSLDLQRREYLAADRFHWNPAGHERMAKLIYGLIVERDLLPDLSFSPWSEATAELDALNAAGRTEAFGPPRFHGRTPQQIASEIEFDELTVESAGQVHGGVDGEGFVSPYAAMILRNRGKRVRLEGRCLPSPVLDGASVSVFADEFSLGEIELRAGRPIELDLNLPAALARRTFISLRFLAHDYVYRGSDLQRCVSLRLSRVAVLP